MATDATDILIQRIRSQLSQGGVDASTLFQQTSTLLSTTANYAQILGTATGGIAQANAIALVGGSTAAAAEQAAFIAAGAATAGIGAGVALIVSFILAFLSGSNQSSESEQLAQLIEQLNVILQGVNNTTLTGYWQDKLHDIGSAWNSPQGALGDDLDYLSAEGTKGTHGPQEILPNSYPLDEANPCPSCPSGFVYENSNGNSIRQAGQLQLRRRLRSGLTASLTYTYSKSIDDDAYLGGQGHMTASSGGQAQSAALSTPTAAVAQNWLDPRAERSLSSFDQRQLLSVQAQYTSGEGLAGGTLLGGWRGRMLKEWTVLSTFTLGSGLPETPILPDAVPGTGFSNIIRPDLTGASIYNSGGLSHLNAAAFSAPVAGQWGTAGRNSIIGPDQLTLNSSLARTFRPHGKLYLDLAVTSTNTLNHAAFSSWNNLVNSTQFGLPVSPGGMRSLQTSVHLRFQ